MAAVASHPVAAAPRRTSLGLLLTAPAAIALVVAYAVPAVWTVGKSLTRSSVFGSGEWVGTDNYTQLAEAGLWGDIGYALSLAVVPALLVTAVAAPLALLLHRAGTATRRLGRVVLALPLALVTPAGFAVGWRYAHPDPSGPAGSARAALWVTTAGLAIAIGVTLYLAVLRSPGGALARRGGLLVGGLALLAAAALGLQQFTYPSVLRTSGTTTPLTTMYRAEFERLSPGQAAAVSALLLALLAVLGVAATLTMIASGLRIEVETGPAPAPGRAAYAAGAVVGLLVLLAVVAYGLWPWLQRLGGDTPLPDGVTAGRALLNTWLPPLLSTVVGITLAVLAAVGIGALRPFGPASEWLLLPFGIWLFVGSGPQLPYLFATTTEAGVAGTWLTLVPHAWIIVPALFVLTLLFRGQRARWDRLRAAGVRPPVGRTLVLPALPMVALLAGVAWVVQAQDLLRQLSAAAHPDLMTGPVAVVLGTAVPNAAEPGLGLALPPVLAVLLVLAAVALHVGYLDRVTLRTGAEAPAGPQPSADRGEQLGAGRAG